MPRLTKKYVEGLPSKDKPYVEWDSLLTGFGCKAYPTGRKVYYYKYRNITKKVIWITIGKHGLWTVETARNQAQIYATKISNGIDPKEEKKEQKEDTKQSLLFKDFWDIFDEKYIQQRHKKGTIQRNLSRISRYILPYFGKMKIKNISYDDVLKFMEIYNLKKAPIQAARCLALLSPAFKQAELWGHREKGSNPCIGISKKATGKKERFLTQEEKESLEEILFHKKYHNHRSPYAIGAVALLLYTGCRKSEVTHLKWEEVHLKEKYIYLKDEDEKGRSIKTGTRTVPLNSRAIEVLESMEKQEGNPYVFCGKLPKTCIQEIRKTWEYIRDAAGLTDVRLHDLRHSFASFALKKGVDLYTVSKLLGHKNIATTTRYAHLELGALKEATNKIFE